MQEKTSKILSRTMNNRLKFVLLSALSVALIVNTVIAKSVAIGIAVSLVFLCFNSVVAGKLFFSGEASFSRMILGLASFISILAFVGSAMLFVGFFTEKVSIGALIVLSFVLLFFAARMREPQLQNSTRNSISVNERMNGKIWSLVLVFFLSIAAAFYLLLLGRTSEGGASVWLTIPESFISVFLLVSLLLGIIVLFSQLSDTFKLGLISIFSFLVHSLFLLVWYPGRYGDPWTHLGKARFVAKAGMPYGYAGLIQRGQFVDILKYRGQQVLLVFFERMFNVDIYWAFIVLVPLLWAIFVPFLSYRIAKSLSSGKSRLFPLVAALSTEIVSPLITWGAVAVPNSLGFIFLFLTVALTFCWMDKGGRRIWFAIFIVATVSFLVHPQAGIFAFMLFLFGTVVHKFSNRFLKILSYGLMFASYPLVMIVFGAGLSLGGLIALESYLSYQSDITTILLVLGLVGLVLGIKGKYVNNKKALLIFVFYLTVEFEYYFVGYGMTNWPFAPGRMLPIGFLLLAPLVALGLLTMADTLRNVVLHFSMRLIFKRLKVNMNLRKIGVLLICLFFSVQATSGLYGAYPRQEIVKVQPSQYEIDAVYYLDSTVETPYVVLGSPIFASLATGFLGEDYAYFGGVPGWFGVASYGYPTQRLYSNMADNPSIRIMEEGMSYIGAKTCYFVVSIREPKFDTIVQRVSEILPVDRIFGDGKLYVFKYPLPIIEESGPDVKVVFDDGASVGYAPTKVSYMFRSQANPTVTLSGHSSYNITDYPLAWTFLDLTVNNASTSFHASSDINAFIYKSGLSPSDVLRVKWLSNLNYPDAGWKEDSFDLSKWRRSTGSITPEIKTDGNVLTLSWNFTPEKYQPYYFVRDCDISTNDYQYLIVRWKSTSGIAVVHAYFETEGQNIVPYGSHSPDWAITIAKLTPDERITQVMVGITNLYDTSISGIQTLYIDSILLVN